VEFGTYHASPLPRTLHWLPVQQRIDYKVALLTFKVRSTSTPSYLRLLIQDREHGRNLRSTTTALCQPSTTTTFAKRVYRCSAPAVWNSRPKTVVISDYVTVQAKDVPLLPGFPSSLFSVAHRLAPAPPKSRSYGAIRMRLLLLLLLPRPHALDSAATAGSAAPRRTPCGDSSQLMTSHWKPTTTAIRKSAPCPWLKTVFL